MSPSILLPAKRIVAQQVRRTKATFLTVAIFEGSPAVGQCSKNCTLAHGRRKLKTRGETGHRGPVPKSSDIGTVQVRQKASVPHLSVFVRHPLDTLLREHSLLCLDPNTHSTGAECMDDSSGRGTPGKSSGYTRHPLQSWIRFLPFLSVASTVD